MKLRIGILVGLLMLSAGAAFADLDFNIVSNGGGSIGYAGLTNPLIGKNIVPTTITGLSTTANNGAVLDCVGCLLNFTTGDFVSTGPGGWNFLGGGSITVTGAVTEIPSIPAHSILLSGIFDSAEVDKSSGTFKVAIAAFIDVKNDDLAIFYGYQPGLLWQGNLNISFRAAGSPPNAFTSTNVLSGDVINAVPDGGVTLMLLGGALVGLETLRRKLRV